MTTRIFRMGSGELARKILRIYGKPSVMILAALAIAGVVAGILLDIRYFILGLIVVFIVSPAVLAMLYYSQGLKRISCLNLIDHTLTLRQEGVELLTYNGDGEPARLLNINKEDFGEMIIGSDSVTFLLRKRDDGFLWIPVSAFATPEEFGDFVNSLNRIDK